MDAYELQVMTELSAWQKKMMHRPSLLNKLSKKVQTKINNWIPEKVHNAITVTIKQMIRGVLFGATHTTTAPLLNAGMQEREEAVQKKIDFYRKTKQVL